MPLSQEAFNYFLFLFFIVKRKCCGKVIIEINANPWRLDLDWRWVHYALEKGVLISINPDAHEMDGYKDMRFGLLVGRKAGLTAEMTFNAFTQQQAAEHFEKKKAGRL